MASSSSSSPSRNAAAAPPLSAGSSNPSYHTDDDSDDSPSPYASRKSKISAEGTDDDSDDSPSPYIIGVPLLEVFSVIHINDGTSDCNPFGYIQLRDANGIQHIASSKNVFERIHHYSDEVVVTVRGPICSLDGLSIKCHVFDGNYRYDCVEDLNVDEPNEVEVRQISLRSKAELGWISIMYGIFRTATAAKVRVRFFSFNDIDDCFEPFCTNSLYGAITATNSKLDSETCTSILFVADSEHKVSTNDDGSIILSKSGIAVPLGSQLIVDFSLFYGGQHYKGSIEFRAATTGEVVEYIKVTPDNMIQITINWVVDPGSLHSFYDLDSATDDESSSTSSTSSSGSKDDSKKLFHAQELDFPDTTQLQIHECREEPCGLVKSGPCASGAGKGSSNSGVIQKANHLAPSLSLEHDLADETELSPRVQPPIPAVPQTDRNELFSTAVVRLRFGFLPHLEVDESVARKFHYRDYEYHTSGDYYSLRCVTKPMLALINNYFQVVVHENPNDASAAEFIDDHSDLTLFNLIQAAHRLKVDCLLTRTCDIFVSRAKRKVTNVIVADVDDEIELDDLDAFNMLRRGNRWRLTPKSNFVASHRSAFVFHKQVVPEEQMQMQFIQNQEMPFIKRRDDFFIDFARMFMTSNNIDRKAECIHVLERSIRREPRLAERLARKEADPTTSAFIEKEAVPHIVQLLSDEHEPLQMEAIQALNCLLSSSCRYVPVVSQIDALRAASAIIKCPQRGMEIIVNMGMMVAVIAENDCICAEERRKALLEVVSDLFHRALGSYDSHKVSACRALSSQTYEHTFYIEKEICLCLVDFIRNADTSTELVGAALEVVGNICTWGDWNQIKILIQDCGLLPCLANVLLCDSKSFREEACKIISNVVAHSRANGGRKLLIEDMHEAKLMEPLYSLLKDDEPDVKMEAAWACGNVIFGFAPHQIDQIDG